MEIITLTRPIHSEVKPIHCSAQFLFFCPLLLSLAKISNPSIAPANPQSRCGISVCTPLSLATSPSPSSDLLLILPSLFWSRCTTSGSIEFIVAYSSTDALGSSYSLSRWKLWGTSVRFSVKRSPYSIAVASEFDISNELRALRDSKLAGWWLDFSWHSVCGISFSQPGQPTT